MGVQAYLVTSEVFALIDQQSSQVIFWPEAAPGRVCGMWRSRRNPGPSASSHFPHLWHSVPPAAFLQLPSGTLLLLQRQAGCSQFCTHQFRA